MVTADELMADEQAGRHLGAQASRPQHTTAVCLGRVDRKPLISCLSAARVR